MALTQAKKLIIPPLKLWDVSRRLASASSPPPHVGIEGRVDEVFKPFSDVPGPKNIPFLGNFLSVKAPGVGRDPKEICAIAKHLHHEYGNLVRLEVPFRSPMLLVFCPDLTEKVYRCAGPQPIRMGFHAMNYWRMQDDYFKGGKGLLVSQKEEWYEFRRKVQQPMLRPKSTLRYNDVLEEVAMDFINLRVLQIRDNRNEMPDNFLSELYRWGLESVSCLALNVRLGCLNPNLAEDSEQVQIINAASTIFKSTAVLDNGIQFWKFFPSKSKDLAKFLESCQLFKNIAFKYIHASLEHIRANPTSEIGGDPTLLELFHERGCDEATSVTMALDMLFAGIDTSSHTAAFAMYRLATNPKAQDALYDEVCQHLPNKNSKLDKMAVERMPYMKAVVKETLRMNPPAIANSRKMEEPLVLDGYQIPAGAEVVPFHYTMMNSPHYESQINSYLNAF